MRKRLLATLLSLCLVVGLFPTAAMAVDEELGGDLSPACICTALCTEEAINEACDVCKADYSACAYTEPTPPDAGGSEFTPCTASEGCTLADGHEGECVLPDNKPTCAKLDGCIGGAHDPNCPLYVEPEDGGDGITPPANTGLEDDPDDGIAPLNNDNGMSGSCGATESDNVTWALTENSESDGDTTYTLTISGSGAMADYETQGTPWYEYRESITKIVLPDGLTRIGKSAFLQTAITDVTIPDTVTSIGQNAFWNCNTIETEIPASVTELGETAFYGTFDVTVAEDNPSYSAVGKIIYDKNKTKLLQVSQDIEGTLSIPETVEEIGAYTFHGCSAVTGELVIPDSVRIIGNGAFSGTGITSLKLGANVQTIGVAAFSETNLSGELKLPDGLKEIGEAAFSECKQITEVTIPDTVTEIGYGAFSYNSATQKIAIPYGDIKYGTYQTAGQPYIFSMYGDNSALKTVILGSSPDGVNANILFARSLKNIEYLVFGSGVKQVADYFASPFGTSFKGGLYPSTLQLGNGNTSFSDKATKFTLTTQSELTYKGTLQMMTFEKPQEGEDVSSKITYSSSDPAIASVDSNGLITANAASDTPVIISASYEGCVFSELELRVTPIALTYCNKDDTSQVNPGSVSYKTAATPTDVNDLLTFKWKDSPNTEVTLTEGTDIDYTYTVPVENGGSGVEATADFLPMTVGKYEVKFNLLNPNYTFARTDEGTTNTLTIQANVTKDNQERAYISVLVTETEFTYDGTGKLPVTGNLTAYESASTSANTVDIGTFNVHIEGLNETVFESTTTGVAAGTDITAIEGLTLPTAPGTYVIIVSAASDTHYLYKSQVFDITKATVTIKANDVTVYVGDEMPTFTYTVNGLVNEGDLTGDITLSCSATDTNTAGTYTITPGGGTLSDTDHYNDIVHEPGTLTVRTRSSGGGSSSSNDYTVSVDSGRHGSVTVSPKRADKGTTVTLTVTPDEGYVLDALTVTTKSGDTVKLTNQGNGKYTFTMPRSAVTVEASFVPEADPDIPAFTDVPADAYYTDAVAWAVENGITNGTSATTFSPNTSCTRAQMVTFLWRAAGSPEPATTNNPFTDVQSGAYYYEAVLWAVEQGITNGTSATTFSPDVTVTRGQTVTFLWRFNGSLAVSGGSFADVPANAYYADAVAWAVAEGITNGTSATTFGPDDPCTRAQIVTFMYRNTVN